MPAGAGLIVFAGQWSAFFVHFRKNIRVQLAQVVQLGAKTQPGAHADQIAAQAGWNFGTHQTGRLLVGHGGIAVGDEGVVQLAIPVVKHAAVVQQESVVADLFEIGFVLVAQSVEGGVDVFGHQQAGPPGLDLGLVRFTQIDVIQPLEIRHHGHLERTGAVTDGVVVGKKRQRTFADGLGIKFIGQAFGGGESFVAFAIVFGVVQDQATFQKVEQAVLAAAFFFHRREGLVVLTGSQLGAQILEFGGVGGATAQIEQDKQKDSHPDDGCPPVCARRRFQVRYRHQPLYLPLPTNFLIFSKPAQTFVLSSRSTR